MAESEPSSSFGVYLSDSEGPSETSPHKRALHSAPTTAAKARPAVQTTATSPPARAGRPQRAAAAAAKPYGRPSTRSNKRAAADTAVEEVGAAAAAAEAPHGRSAKKSRAAKPAPLGRSAKDGQLPQEKKEAASQRELRRQWEQRREQKPEPSREEVQRFRVAIAAAVTSALGDLREPGCLKCRFRVGGCSRCQKESAAAESAVFQGLLGCSKCRVSKNGCIVCLDAARRKIRAVKAKWAKKPAAKRVSDKNAAAEKRPPRLEPSTIPLDKVSARTSKGDGPPAAVSPAAAAAPLRKRKVPATAAAAPTAQGVPPPVGVRRSTRGAPPLAEPAAAASLGAAKKKRGASQPPLAEPSPAKAAAVTEVAAAPTAAAAAALPEVQEAEAKTASPAQKSPPGRRSGSKRSLKVKTAAAAAVREPAETVEVTSAAVVEQQQPPEEEKPAAAAAVQATEERPELGEQEPQQQEGEPTSDPTLAAEELSQKWWDPLDPAKLAAAQAALHVSTAAVPWQLPLCRDRQAQAIDEWLAERLRTGQGGSLYVSGLPGTGKSLTALELVRRCGRHAEGADSRCQLPPALLAVNCMRLADPKQVTERLLAGHRTACRQDAAAVAASAADPLVQVPDEDVFSAGSQEAAQEALQRIALQPLPAGAVAQTQQWRRSVGGRKSLGGGGSGGSDGRGMIVAVLDELDGLLAGRQGDALVGQLFSLAHAPKSRLILVGIANSIDLVQQLMRPGGTLHRHNLRPAHVIFPAYLRGEISRVVAQRLESLPGPVIEPNAIELCARKIANGSGDMRRALQAASTAVAALAADEQRAAAAGAGAAVQKKRVGMRHMAAALSNVTGGIGAGNDAVTAIRKLPVPQQLLMATVAKLLGERLASRGLAVKIPSGIAGQASAAARFIGGGTATTTTITQMTANKALADGHRRRTSAGGAGSSGVGNGGLTVGDLKGAHAGLCKRVGVGAYTAAEFGTAMDMLCTLGLVELKGGAGQGQRQRVTLQVAEDDVLMALADVPVLKDVVGA